MASKDEDIEVMDSDFAESGNTKEEPGQTEEKDETTGPDVAKLGPKEENNNVVDLDEDAELGMATKKEQALPMASKVPPTPPTDVGRKNKNKQTKEDRAMVGPAFSQLIEGSVDELDEACGQWIHASSKRSVKHERTHRFFVRLSTLLFVISVSFATIIAATLFSVLGDENGDDSQTLKLVGAVMATIVAIADGLNKVISSEAEKHRIARASYSRIRRGLELLLLKYPKGSPTIDRDAFLEDYGKMFNEVDDVMNESPTPLSCFLC